ncbi:hypothetical protein HKCCSP123_14860 [Rhodobacterales bacterium HKCCSP123]|nr:hypothetical protein [Rhodobacterales bacterium HKCCSP123]
MGRSARILSVVLGVSLVGLIAAGGLFLWILATGMDEAFTDPGEGGTLRVGVVERAIPA